MAKTLAQVQADIAAQTTVDQSAIVLIQGLQQQIQAMAANGGASQDELQALDDSITANTQAMASAVSQNTPASGGAGASAGAAGSASATAAPASGTGS